MWKLVNDMKQKVIEKYPDTFKEYDNLPTYIDIKKQIQNKKNQPSSSTTIT